MIKTPNLIKLAFSMMFFIVIAGASLTAISTLGATQVQAAVVSDIEVRGNTRMDAETIKSFLTIHEGQKFDNGDIDDSVKALFNTSLFSDVSIYQSGRTLIVEVDENSTINQVFFEGNKRLKDDALSSMVQSQPRGIYSSQTVSSDVDLLNEAYSRVGRGDAVVSSEIVPLANNRVNIIYRVNEGGKTKIKSLTFVGNNAFRTPRLRDVLSTKKSHLLSWLKSDDIYDPDRLAADEERLRRFYFNNGYADFQILSTSAILDDVANEYNITITIDEGSKYTFGDISIDSTISGVDGNSLYGLLETQSGDNYSAKKVEDTIIALTEAVAANGYAFAEVVPRGDRDFSTNTINVAYLIDEGARVYIERIIIIGNDISRDYVIRREFDISEGDAFNQVFLQKAKRRLEALGLYDSIDINTRPGSAADQVVVVVKVKDKASGEFAIGGGYSSSSGALAEISFTEKNFMGRGQLLRVSVAIGEESDDYRLSFTEPYFLGRRISAGFDVARSSSDSSSTQSYSSDTTSGTIRFGLPLTDQSSVSPFYTYNSEQTTVDGTASLALHNGIPAVAGDATEWDWVRSGFGYTYKFNSLDNQQTPRDGFKFELNQVAYGAGGDATYLKSTAKAALFNTISEDLDLVSMVRARAGANTTYGNASGYRALDNFFQGSSAIRGFNSSGFGPRDSDTGDALGGMYFWNATAEVNFPAPFLPESFGMRGALFADAGALWGVDSTSKSQLTGPTALTSGQADDNSVRASAGVSLIWNSPFGPLRFDYAFPFLKEDYDNTREFNFGISSSF